MSPHRFVVRRQVYTPPDAAGVRRLLPEKYDRAAVFPKADQAFADCAKRLAEFRRTANPFQLGGPCLFYQSNLPAFAFHDYLLDHNITPPLTSLTANPNYVFWWVKNNRTFTDRDREVVWRACDKLKPFDVIEEDDRKAVHVVVEVAAHEVYDIWVVPPEGGFLITAAMKLRRARDYANELHETRYEHFHERPFAMEVTAFASVETIPTDAAPVGFQTHVCTRQAYQTEAGGYAVAVSPSHCNAGARVPLAGFGDSGSATADRDRRTAAARRTVNPFALVWTDFFHFAALCDSEADSASAELPNGLSPVEVLHSVHRLRTTPPMPREPTADWYDLVVQWSPEFVDAIWSTFADFRLFEVIEVPLK